ncbi:MAG TPA: hypothetical protein VM869_37215 [Enhygromyxa sp.]|nr:hypothetical protein [Enhygromyxa sp.]
MSLHPGVAELLAAKRRGSLEASRHRFTVSREEALLRLREQVRVRGDERWDWTLYVVRAANALSEIAEAKLEARADEQLETTTIDVITPGIELTELSLGLGLADILGGALEPDLGEPLGGTEPAQRLARFRMLMGRALNAALAHERVSVELLTPAGGRRFERREQLLEGRDPYVERKLPGCEGKSRFVIRMVEPRAGLTSRLGRWLRSKGDVGEELATRWRAWRLADHETGNVDKDGNVELGPALQAKPVELGTHALLGPCRARPEAPASLRSSLWLVRDGVVLLDLGPLLREQLLDQASLVGWIDCPSLRLTADDRSVTRDANFELLIAWLNDFVARSDASGAVRWPESLAALAGGGPQTAMGGTVSAEKIAEDARRGRELIYVWRNQAAAVPAYAKAKIFTLWPSELRLLAEQFPDLRLVPLRAFGGHSDFDPADLTALRAGSYEPLVLVKNSPIGGEPGGLAAVLRLSIEAYVHRAPTATMGFIELLAYERRVAQVRERSKVFPGVTLICRLDADGPELDVAALRRDALALGHITELVRQRTLAHWEALLAHVMRWADPWETPLLRAALDELGPGSIELRYQSTEQGLRLAWRDSVLLDVIVGKAPDGPKQLRDVLRQIREPGFLVVAHEHKRYEHLRSKDPRLQPWLLSEWARPLVERVVGRAVVLEMPVVPEAHPLVLGDPVEDQRHLVHQRATIAKTLERASTDPLARLRLLGHLLVARGLEQDAFGLEGVPLLDRYDPRALTPTRLVSLASVLSEKPRPGLVPAGAVHRNLPRPMIEATPGLAALLAEVESLEPGLTAAVAKLTPEPDAELSSESRSAPVRRRARALPPLLATAVVHPLAIGRLQVAGDGSSEGIALWARGLRIGELELPEPLGRVSGRLLLTEQGQRIDRNVVRREITNLARGLIADALRQRTLLPPDGPQRRRLDHFVEYVRTVVRAEDRFGLAAELGVAEPSDRARKIATLRQLSLRAAPLRPISNRREALLVDIVRQSVAMPLHFDTGLLSWRPAKLGKRRRDGSFEIEFGLRNAWIKRALDEDRALSPQVHRHAAFLAGVITVAAFFEQAREQDVLDVAPEHLVVALWRLLSLV